MKIYCRHPFNTTSKVIVTQDCKPEHQGAKDLNFVGMPYGTPVYAMESGVVDDIRRDRPHCPTSDCPGYANNVVVRGSDGFYTEYAHITPVRRRYPSLSSTTPPYVVRPRPLAIGDQIIEGQLLGWVDNSGWTRSS